MRRLALASAVLALLTVLLYAPVRRHEFLAYDDGAYITKNAHVSTGLTPENVAWAFTEFHSANWHPLTWLSHQLDCTLFGLEPGPHHLVNVGLHALNAVLLLLFLASATGRFWPALLVALLFAVHPLRVESVAWAAERKDVLSGTFFFLTLWAYVAYARRPSRAAYAGVFAALALGLMAKPMLVTVPFLLLLLDRWPLGRWEKEGAKKLVVEKLPLFALIAASCFVTWLAQRAGEAIRSFDAVPLDARIANAFVAYAAYVGKSLWPTGLTFFYPHPALVADTFSVVSPRVLVAAVIVLGLSILAVVRLRSLPSLFTGWFWYVGMLVPVIGVFQVGGQWIADRYAYLPLVGIYVAVVWGVDSRFRAPVAKKAAFALGLLFVAAFAAVTRIQLPHWRNSRVLFERGLALTEGNYPALSNLGYIEFQEGNLARAEELFERTIEVAPNLVDAHSNLGAVHMQRGEYDEAIACFERALRIQPSWVNARLNLGLVYEEQERFDEARAQYEAAVRTEPDNVGARLLLGRALLRAGEVRAAAPHLEPAAARNDPRAVEPLAWILATTPDTSLRDPRRALQLATTATRLAPQSWRAWRALAAAHAASGSFPAALEALGQALARSPSDETEGLLRLRERLKAGEALFE